MVDMVLQPENLESLAFSALVRWTISHTEHFIDELRPKSYLRKNQRAKENERIANQEPRELTEQEKLVVDRHIKLFQNYISILHHYFHNKLLEQLVPLVLISMRKRKLMREVFTLLIESFFTSKLTVLKLTGFAKISYLPPLCSKAHLLTRLTHLELKLIKFPCRTGQSVEERIIQILKPLHALRYLTVAYHCTDNILKCVVENCTLVEGLDISQSGTRVDDNSMRLLIQLRCLKSVHLSGTSVGPSGVEMLLLSCDNLEHIDVSGVIAHTLDGFYTSKETYAGRVFKLKSLDTGASLKQLELLVEICPHIQYMTLRKCARDDECNLKALVRFKNIQQLKLEGYNFLDDRLKDTLRDIGRSLTDLHLNNVRQIHLDALKAIRQMCPNLTNLSLINCDLLGQPLLGEQLEVFPFTTIRIN